MISGSSFLYSFVKLEVSVQLNVPCVTCRTIIGEQSLFCKIASSRVVMLKISFSSFPGLRMSDVDSNIFQVPKAGLRPPVKTAGEGFHLPHQLHPCVAGTRQFCFPANDTIPRPETFTPLPIPQGRPLTCKQSKHLETLYRKFLKCSDLIGVETQTLIIAGYFAMIRFRCCFFTLW